MSFFSENISIKISGIQKMSWNKSLVFVAERPHHALVFRLKGSALFEHDDIKLSTGCEDVFYMPADYSYRAKYDTDNEIIAIHFESKISSGAENFHFESSETIKKLFETAVEIWQKKEGGYYYAAMSVFCEIIEYIAVHFAPTLPNKTTFAFDNAVKLLDTNFTSPDFSVNDMIKQSHMSSTYFRKLFVSKFGVTPIKHLMDKRLVHAEKLLATGNYTVSEVAEKSGFSDVKYFCRAVKKAYGVPPSKLYKHKKQPNQTV